MLTNPVLISVVVMCLLCLFKVNILLSIMISAVVAGATAGMPFGEIMTVLVDNMGGQSNTSLSYILLGALAVGIYQTGLATILSNKIEKMFGKNSKIFLFILAAIACCSQNIVPIHIAFIPILVPPLLTMMNRLKIDRRGAACALTFGLKAPYIVIPAGFGLIFHGIIADNLNLNGMPIEASTVWRYMLIPGAGMTLGLFLSILLTYSKPREYKDLPISAGASANDSIVTDKFTRQHLGATIGALAAFGIQLLTDSLPLGALVGIAIMVAFSSIPFKELDNTMDGGIKLMGFIAFVMLVASGFGGVIRATGGVDAIVSASAQAVAGNKLLAAVVMLLIGLLVTMGIGTSFGTIPIIATIYVPLCLALGFSGPATAVLVGVAGALGDAGSPASDSTLGPTSGLNADGQHDHIWDTCVPTFIHYNIPLLIFGTIAAVVL
ncbi:MAG: Na+/H+ antiporter family protein [Synergistaceae bacterium]|jgi:predicted histidine transporter YuiF (NhaC family)|nr:Na+/H+ antiporter family protein [Synergistaceae bacterium]